MFKFKVGEVLKNNFEPEFHIQIIEIHSNSYAVMVIKNNTGKYECLGTFQLVAASTIHSDYVSMDSPVPETKCSCDSHTLFVKGCKCGCFKAERNTNAS